MQRKKLIAVGIALALQTYYLPAIAADSSDDDNDCPTDVSVLSKIERDKLSKRCLADYKTQDNHWGWAIGGIAALAAGVAIGVDSNDHDAHHSSTPAIPDGGDVTPPDDGGGNVTPPDDGGGNVTPPDDGGGNVTPPDDDGGDVTPPDDDGGDVTPPDDDGGDVTPPDDDGGDVTPPDDDGGDVTPPDDGGGDVTPPDTSVITFSNGVTLDKGADTLHFDNIKLDNGTSLGEATVSYSQQNDQWQLTTPDGKTLQITGWHVTSDNAAVIEGTQENGQYWKYDSRGYLILANENTQVIAGDGTTNITDRGLEISGANNTAAIISGDKTHNTLTGDSTVTGGAVGLVITGDNTTNTISGHTTVDGATGALISGNRTSSTFSGDVTVSGGGTGIVFDGDNMSISNTGISDISGKDSTGSIINGNNAQVTNDGNLNILDGATGAKIIGDGAIVDNTGTSTVSGEGSTGLYIDGDNALVINEGDQVIADGATGTYIDGDNARIINTGNMTVDGAGSTISTITGNNARLTQNGELLVINGAAGLTINGEDGKLVNSGQTTVSGEGSVGFVIAGKHNTFNSNGDINTSLNGTGAQVSGEGSLVSLDGNINVISAQDSDDIFRGATGVSISGNSNTVNIVGDVNMSADYAPDSKITSNTPLTGVSISGNNNTIALDGKLNIDVNDLATGNGQYLNAIGLNVTGDGNSADITGGIDITHNSGTPGYDFVTITGIEIDGNSEVVLSGQSTVDTTTIAGGSVILAQVANGGSLVLDEDSAIDINVSYKNSNYYTDNALLMANGEGTSIDNRGDITSNGVYSVMRADNGAEITNNGNILVYATSSGGDDNIAIASASGKESVVHNKSGGDITVITDQTPAGDDGTSSYPIVWYTHTFYAMLASAYGNVINDKGATIHLQGAGVYGVSASKGTALNAGDIDLDGFVPALDEEGNTLGSTYWHPSSLYLTSSGMVAGSTDKGNGDATATNTGTITVNNAGFGMMALNGGTAINQGIITLTADEGVTKTDENQLVGMAALNGGTVVNDTTGVINIYADYGKPFFADSSSMVINYGTVCIGDDCQDSAEYNPTDTNVSLNYADGLITAEGENMTSPNNIYVSGKVGNDGTVNTDNISVIESGNLSNNTSGTLNSDISLDKGMLTNNGEISGTVSSQGGTITNSGKIGSVDAEGGSTFTNGGEVTGTLTVGGGSTVINGNTASVNKVEMWKGTLDNQGYIGTLMLENTTGVVSNEGTINKINFNAATVFNNNGTVNDAAIAQGATFNNLSSGVLSVPEDMWKGTLNNWGEVDGTINIASSAFTFYNAGTFNGKVKTASANGGKVINDGVINASGNNTVAMSASGSAKMVNNGVINLGTEGTSDTGMVAMQLESNAKSDAVIENNGAINIYASNSYAFSQLGSNGHIVNNGTVYIDDSVTNSGFIKQQGKTIEGSGENGDGTEVHYVDFTAPTEPTVNNGTTTVTADSTATSSGTNDLSGYVVGTSADGSAGQLKVSNASMNGVGINTGFTAGTADTTVSFDNVVEGNNLSDASAIQSTSVVWNANGSQDADGNVDVTMTKNAYADVATDSSVSDVASALDAGYTNNELYTSLNVGTTAELNSALKQVSGSQATTVFREARVLSNRFTMLADAAPQIKDGLAFNVVAKGDPRAELGNDTQYDMLALRQTLDLTASQNLTLEYGIARLDGDGSQTAGDNGLTGGYSQFFGLKHSMAFDEGLAWNNSLRYDLHNLDSSRSVSYGDTNKVADSDVHQQYLEFRSEGAKTFTLMNDTLKVTPYAGVKFRHTLEGGYKERSAGDFNLSMNAGSETAVDSIVGMKFDYTGENGWSASATLEGGPNLSYAKSQRTASLQGAAGQSFSVDDDQKGGGVNGLATVGVKYSTKDASLNLDAYQWKEDNISDKGFMLNFRKTFR
ncbi:autotransporter adhesin BigA [Citrobacter portucalensis]|uniref:BigA/YdbA N-terminal beta-barrel domain-containing protein n=1 Tax=Citrobacter portucalensis TaxID=1639133 RepID=UPI00351D775F